MVMEDLAEKQIHPLKIKFIAYNQEVQKLNHVDQLSIMKI